MDFEEFREKLVEDLHEALPERLKGASIEESSVQKLQNRSYDGITVRPEGTNIGVTLDVSKMYEEMDRGTDYESVLAEAVAIVSNATADMPNFDVEQFADYEAMKEKLSIQVVPTAGNEDMLKNIPHKEMEDLSLVYRFILDSDARGQQSILVTNNLLENYGITQEQLHKDALEVAPVYVPVQIKSMVEVLADMMGPEFAESGIPTEGMDNMMYVATNESKNYGAGVIAYPDFMDQASEKVGGDFFMLPSSVHEVLIVPDNGEMKREELENMVREVNATQVAPEDQLSNNVYHYDATAHVFELAENYEKRMSEKEEVKDSVIGELKSKTEVAKDAPKKDIDVKKKTMEARA